MKNIKKIILLFVICILLTGCTKYAKTENNKMLIEKKTGLKIVENVLCKPTDKDVIKIYNDNNISLKKLSNCEKFKITDGGYEGVWNTIFVKSLAWIIIKIGIIVKNYGLSIIIVTTLIRLAMYPLTKKTAMQSECMKEAQNDIKKIEKKYEGKNSKEDTIAKSQELSLIYKKYNINPISGCLFAFIQIPLFFAFYEALTRLPVIYEGKFLNLKLGMSPIIGIQNGNYFYILIVILVILTTIFSFKLNSSMTSNNQQDQMKYIIYFSVIMIAITSFSISIAIAIYWIANSTFTIIQNILVKRRKDN